MAIDPSISLQIAPVPQIDLTRIQQLRNLMGQEQLMGQQFLQSQLQQQLTQAQIPITQAQLPGTIAMSKQQTIAAETQEKLQQGRKKISEFLTEQVSRPGATGAIDHDEVILRAFREGHPEAAFEYQTSRNNTLAGQIKNSSDALNVVDQQSLLAASMLTRVPEAQRPAAAEQIRQTLNQQFKNTGMNIGDMAIGSLYTTDTKTGQSRLDRSKLDARFQSTVTYENQKRLDEAMDSVFFTPEAMDKDSPLSNRVRDLTAELSKGVVVPNKNMSAREIYRDPNLRQYLPPAALAQLMPQGSRDRYLAEASAAGLQVMSYDSAIRAVQILGPDFVSLKPGVDAQRLAQRLGVSDVLPRIATAVAEHNMKYPNDPIDPNLAYGQQLAKLTEARNRAQRQADEFSKKSKIQVLPSESRPGAQQQRTDAEEKPTGRRSDFGQEATLSRRVLQAYQDMQPEASRLSVDAYIDQLKKQFPKTKFNIVD